MAGSHTYLPDEVLTDTTLNGYVRDQVITICTSGTRPTTTQVGRTIRETDTGHELVWDGSGWVDMGGWLGWTSWTPVWTQGVSTPSFTNVRSVYTRRGRTVHVSSMITLTSAGTAGAGFLCSLPVTPASAAAAFHGSWFYDNNASGRLSGVSVISTGNKVHLITSDGKIVGAEAPYSGAVAIGHSWGFSITYEAAT